MEYAATFIWLALIIVFAVIEGANPQLISIWFAGGALISMIVSFFPVSPQIQILVFVFSSAALLVLTRPFVKKKIEVHTVKTNSDSNIGKTGIVTVKIDNVPAQGLVRIGGQSWSARSADDSVIPEGTYVTVERIEGVKLIVVPQNINE